MATLCAPTGRRLFCLLGRKTGPGGPSSGGHTGSLVTPSLPSRCWLPFVSLGARLLLTLGSYHRNKCWGPREASFPKGREACAVPAAITSSLLDGPESSRFEKSHGPSWGRGACLVGNAIRSCRQTRVRDRPRAGVAGPLSSGWDGSAGVVGRLRLGGGASPGSLRDRTPWGPPACAGLRALCSRLCPSPGSLGTEPSRAHALPLGRPAWVRMETAWTAVRRGKGQSRVLSMLLGTVHGGGLGGLSRSRRLPRGGRTGWRSGVWVPFVPGAPPARPHLASGLPMTSELLTPVWGKRGGVWLHGGRCPGPR